MALFRLIMDVLDEVERTGLSSLTRPRTMFFDPAACEPLQPVDRSNAPVASIADAYYLFARKADGAEEGSNEAPHANRDTCSTVEERMATIDLSKASLHELTRLRRRLAWEHHPDRRPEGAQLVTMADANARIDEAIRKLRSGRNAQ